MYLTSRYFPKYFLLSMSLTLASISFDSLATDCKVNDPDIADTYVGSCKNGLANGQGVATGHDSYKGGFLNGNKHGKGTYTWADGTTYAGEYRDDNKHGKGTYTWANGNIYTGEYRDGKEHGRGTHTWTNGDRYSGNWVNGERTGLSNYELAKARKAEHTSKCQHLYQGRVFTGAGGLLGIKQNYMVVGFSPQTGRATIKSPDTGYLQEVSCASIPD